MKSFTERGDKPAVGQVRSFFVEVSFCPDARPLSASRRGLGLVAGMREHSNTFSSVAQYFGFHHVLLWVGNAKQVRALRRVRWCH